MSSSCRNQEFRVLQEARIPGKNQGTALFHREGQEFTVGTRKVGGVEGELELVGGFRREKSTKKVI